MGHVIRQIHNRKWIYPFCGHSLKGKLFRKQKFSFQSMQHLLVYDRYCIMLSYDEPTLLNNPIQVKMKYFFLSESCSVVSDSLRPHGVSMEFSRPEYWSGQPFPSAGDLPNPGIEPRSPALQVDSLPAEPQGKPQVKNLLENEVNVSLLGCKHF